MWREISFVYFFLTFFSTFFPKFQVKKAWLLLFFITNLLSSLPFFYSETNSLFSLLFKISARHYLQKCFQRRYLWECFWRRYLWECLWRRYFRECFQRRSGKKNVFFIFLFIFLTFLHFNVINLLSSLTYFLLLKLIIHFSTLLTCFLY